MKVLLVFPPITMKERYGREIDDVGGILPPLGLAYLAAVLEEHNYAVEILDAPALSLNVEQLPQQVSTKNPDLIGISAMTPFFHRTLEAVEMIRNVCPDTITVLGGPHASLFSEQTLANNPSIDIVCIGEGEHTLLDLVQTIEGDGDLRRVKGIVFRENGQIVRNPPREPIENLDGLPFPARHLLPMTVYKPLPNQYRRLPVVHLMTSRGCPFGCTYCSNAIFGRRTRTRSPENVVNEIKSVMQDFNAKEIQFWDDTFTLKRSWVMELCQLLIKENFGVLWTCETRVDRVDREILELMAKAGCWKIGYGVESGDQELLDIIKKGITLDQARQAVKLTKNSGIEVGLSFMLALPGETPSKARKTIEFAKELDPDYVQFCITTPYPGTELHDQAKEYGTLIQNFSSYTIWNPVFVPNGYQDKDEVLKMQREAFKAFYYRPSYIIKRLLKARSIGDFKRNVEGLRVVFGFSK